MCGRFNHSNLTWAQLRALMLGDAPEEPDQQIPTSWNVPPTSMVPIIRLRDGIMEGALARWGLIPVWHKGGVKDWKASSFNARIETVATAPTFRDSYRKRRCVVVASGYYEWQTTDGSKRPHYIQPSGNLPALFFAGLWTEVSLSDYKGLTCTVITEPARGELMSLHDRQPVMLTLDGVGQWLSGKDIAEVQRMPGSGARHHEVGRKVGSVKNDGPELSDPV